jgi:beta-phosphoglucomutase-like phosphatase (HAD superfamily)
MRQALLYDAVIFDWFGTLTLTMARATVERAADDLADALGMPRDVFRQAWLATNTARDLGVYATFDAAIARVCAACGVVTTPSACSRMAYLRGSSSFS